MLIRCKQHPGFGQPSPRPSPEGRRRKMVLARPMIERLVNGIVPKKHHLQLRDGTGHLHYEHCITQEGFDAPYTITYHREPPHRQVGSVTTHGWGPREAAPPRDLRKRHYLSQNMDTSPK